MNDEEAKKECAKKNYKKNLHIPRNKWIPLKLCNYLASKATFK